MSGWLPEEADGSESVDEWVSRMKARVDDGSIWKDIEDQPDIEEIVAAAKTKRRNGV